MALCRFACDAFKRVRAPRWTTQGRAIVRLIGVGEGAAVDKGVVRSPWPGGTSYTAVDQVPFGRRVAMLSTHPGRRLSFGRPLRPVYDATPAWADWGFEHPQQSVACPRLPALGVVFAQVSRR